MEERIYTGNDLGAVYAKEKTCFKVWAPNASKVSCRFYQQGDGDNFVEALSMKPLENGVWSCSKDGDLHGAYYTYQITDELGTREVVDLYAKAVGVNGNRGMVVDLSRTNPEGFLEETRPAQVHPTDAIIYELHVRDASIDESSGIVHKGKFIGLTELGTKNPDGLSTGLSHMKELGVTHVQILPSYDYATVDETRLDKPQFNWGYDPKNYNTPEGSYSTDPYHGETRILEMKKMIQALHAQGIRVNMDVVYNHTYDIENSWFHKTVPNYYHRMSAGKFTNGSGCGNETASDHPMMRKFMVDSVVYWAKEYHIDGFRFDLMAVHDLETMREIRKALDEIDPSIMVYGEGWTGGESGLAKEDAALKASISKLPGIGAFNDDIRDGIKGNVFFSDDCGFVNGKAGLEQAIQYGVVGATRHPQLPYEETKCWAKHPSQSINYISCHDNYTFWDKLCIANETDSEEMRKRMTKLGCAIIFTSQGVAFMHAGEEMLRSKPSDINPGEYVENSFCSSDAVNSIKWDKKAEVMDVFTYYQGLIAFRKAHGALRMATAKEVQEHLHFLEHLDENVVAFSISGQPNGESAKELCVIYNARKESTKVSLPEGNWDIYVNEDSAGTKSLGQASHEVEVFAVSCMVLAR